MVDGLPPNEPETYYELWLLRGDETVSLGSFTVGPDGHADTAISIPVDPGGYEAFDISLESEDGDPSHSGDSLLRGPTAPFGPERKPTATRGASVKPSEPQSPTKEKIRMTRTD